MLKVTLRGVKPGVWRRLQVATDLTLRDLHHALQVAMGWTDSHLHEFEVDGSRYGMPDQCKLIDRYTFKSQSEARLAVFR